MCHTTGKENTINDDYYYQYTNFATGQVHNIEMAASTIELCAAFGWAFTWWVMCSCVGG